MGYPYTEEGEETFQINHRVMGILPLLAGEMKTKTIIVNFWQLCCKLLVVVITDVWILLDFVECCIP